ncbi:MAG: hypothetical protein IKK34_02905 [Clostridia bacterium]|nr:hypothetical protein [Clostridia bacterium]
MRDKSIDVGRGLLVLLMVYCHVLQFYGDSQIFSLVGLLIDGINMTVFPTFVFYFGMTAVLAYLRKPYLRALPGMVKTSMRAYGAFVVSGVGFRILREGKALGPGTVRRVMQLLDIPGWSEFLIAFALYGLLLIVLFPLLGALSRRPVVSLFAGAACVACCVLVPYGKVPTRLALLIGGRDFSYFPVVQYMPYFLAGMVFAQGDKRTRRQMLLLAVLCTTAGAAYWVADGRMPSRFPPDWAWILVCALCTAVVVLLGCGLSALSGSGLRRVFDAVCDVLAHFGSRSLYYLLASNIVIFTLVGRGVTPALSRKSIPPWTLPIQSPQGAACWTAVLLVLLWFAARLAGRGAGKKG